MKNRANADLFKCLNLTTTKSVVTWKKFRSYRKNKNDETKNGLENNLFLFKNIMIHILTHILYRYNNCSLRNAWLN